MLLLHEDGIFWYFLICYAALFVIYNIPDGSPTTIRHFWSSPSTTFLSASATSALFSASSISNYSDPGPFNLSAPSALGESCICLSASFCAALASSASCNASCSFSSISLAAMVAASAFSLCSSTSFCVFSASTRALSASASKLSRAECISSRTFLDKAVSSSAVLSAISTLICSISNSASDTFFSHSGRSLFTWSNSCSSDSTEVCIETSSATSCCSSFLAQSSSVTAVCNELRSEARTSLSCSCRTLIAPVASSSLRDRFSSGPCPSLRALISISATSLADLCTNKCTSFSAMSLRCSSCAWRESNLT